MVPAVASAQDESKEASRAVQFGWMWNNTGKWMMGVKVHVDGDTDCSAWTSKRAERAEKAGRAFALAVKVQCHWTELRESW